MRRQMTEYFSELCESIEMKGGYFNAHLHLDRTGTFGDTLKLLSQEAASASHFSLAHKHSLIPLMHESDCYSIDVLDRRVRHYLGMMIELGTTRADTVVDVTDDCVGQTALDCLLAIKHDLKEKIDFRVGAYSPLGFRDDHPLRWELLEKAAKQADFIGALPERDDVTRYPEHIGFEESCRRMLNLSIALKKPVHIHVDQQNIQFENGTEQLLKIANEIGLPVDSGNEPFVWLVHVISPSTYSEARFESVLTELSKLNIGVICCPSAAISMRQVRQFMSPTYNSIARVLEMLAAGIHVRIGSDNICDITSPAGTIDLLDEVFVLCNALRYYDIDVLAKLAAGVRLNIDDINRVKTHLKHDIEQANAVTNRHCGQTAQNNINIKS
jgi:cytosine/creatinine deaminase